MKTHTFHLSGMSCDSCTNLIQGKLNAVPGVRAEKPSLSACTVEISVDAADKELGRIAAELNEVLKPHGYALSAEKRASAVKWSEFKVAAPVALAFVALFIALQKLGIVNLITASEVGYGTAFFIGLIASVSTCMAVVGGLVLSMSASFAKEGDKVRPQALFHLGRFVSFFLLGGAIGILGSSFQLGSTGTGALNLAVALVLLVLGVNLLDLFPWAKRLQPTLPSFIGKRVHALKEVNHTLTPLLVGVLTFFLPCGFTQSMQIYTLSTGSFWTGAFTMSAFALGTFPVLALLSFSSLSIHKKAQSGMFFKTAGLIVIFFGLLNLAGSLVSLGVIEPFFSI